MPLAESRKKERAIEYPSTIATDVASHDCSSLTLACQRDPAPGWRRRPSERWWRPRWSWPMTRGPPRPRSRTILLPESLGLTPNPDTDMRPRGPADAPVAPTVAVEEVEEGEGEGDPPTAAVESDLTHTNSSLHAPRQSLGLPPSPRISDAKVSPRRRPTLLSGVHSPRSRNKAVLAPAEPVHFCVYFAVVLWTDSRGCSHPPSSSRTPTSLSRW